MKSAPYVIILALLLYACGSQKKSKHSNAAVFPVGYDYEKLEGIYTGNFDASFINMNLRKVTGRNVVGYSVHKGLRRNFSGIMEAKGSGFHMVLKEPGNNPNDGVFDIYIDTATFALQGKWTPRNNRELEAKEFKLTKKGGYDEYAIFYDSLNTLSFDGNGECTYEFYPQTDTVIAAQMLTVRGSWTLKDNIYTIEWNGNSVLNEPRSIVPIDSVLWDTAHNYYYKVLKFNNRILSLGEY